jgi:hypothetical protein
MKVLFEFDDKKFVMTLKCAGEISQSYSFTMVRRFTNTKPTGVLKKNRITCTTLTLRK